MTIEKLHKAERFQYARYEEALKNADQIRGVWYDVYKKWIKAVEEEKINAIVEERLKAKV